MNSIVLLLGLYQLRLQRSSKSMIDYERSEHKCDNCLLGFKRRGAFVNHLVSRHPEISLDSIPSLNRPTETKTIMYMCLVCDKVIIPSPQKKKKNCYTIVISAML